MFNCVLVMVGLAVSAASFAQNGPPPAAPMVVAPVGTFDPLKTFAPMALPDPVNVYRSSNGAPGPKYWQNRADYELHAKIDTVAKVLSATETITYTNNSPDALGSLWLNLEQNIYRKDSRAAAFAGSGRRRRSADPNAVTNTEGYAFESVEVQPVGAAKASLAKMVVSDTRMQIQLPEGAELKPGSRIRILIRYHYTIPGLFGGRTSWVDTKQGAIYDMAQWYPRMCVYDDLHGWDTQPYLANEFYLEYGNFSYFVTVPANMIVAGSGVLVNAAEVLTRNEMARLAEARKSDKTVMIRTAQEAAAASADKTTAMKTWHYTMESTRDVSFSASAAFIWDAARMNIPAGAGKAAHAALAESVYPVESAGDAAWGRSTEYLKDAVEHFSARWYPYPYPNAINVAGGSSGMEYPAILFDGIEDKGAALFWITAHEIGHTWFPMVVGFNERRHAWMDEGFNTFIDIFESEEFAGGVYGPKRDGEYAPDPNVPPADQIAKVMADAEAPPIMTRADAIREKYRHPVTYFKSAEGLVLLREDILGPERFDHAFRKFIADWAFKHPAPSDFFRAMESEGGEDLSWFWRGWYFNNWQLDLAVTSATYAAGDSSKLTVVVENKGPLVLPALLRITLADGSHVDLKVPVETWMQNASHTFTVTTGSRAVKVEVDPEHLLPDADRGNNAVEVK
jgi:hypothetical protein